MEVQRVLRRYREGGLAEVMRRAKARLLSEGEYQEKLHPSFEERWQLIRSVIPPFSGSLLDIGANLGDFTARAASEGLVSIGLEREESLIRRAFRTHGKVRDCAFMIADLDLGMCEKLPKFDVVLLLSVHHHWHSVYGAKIAADMLRAITSKANHVLIFEGPSRTGRYESDIPSFEDNLEASVTAYYEAYLQQTVGELTSSITLMGKTRCVGEREPYRWMYALTP